jgi:hypothetical protein
MEINKLSSDEQNILYALPFHIAIWIASADGHVEESEIRRAVSVIHLQSGKAASRPLSEFYNKVSEDLEDKLKILLYNSPKSENERTSYHSKKIVDANSVLKKLDRQFIVNLHNSLRELARQVAKASGGLLGYGSIGVEESRLIDLNLIEIPVS